MAFFMHTIDIFCEHLSAERRLSTHTVQAYRNDLLQLSAYAMDNWQEENIQNLQFADLRNWVAGVSEAGFNAKSVNRKIASLKTFYKFLLRRKIIHDDPTLLLKSLKTQKKPPAFVKNDDMERVMDAQGYTSDFEGLRDRVVMELLYGTGIRLAELLGLKNTDIDFYNKQIKVLGKRNKERLIPVHNALIALLTTYLDHKIHITSLQNLIVTNKGEAAYPVFIQRITKKYLAGSKLPKQSPHVLRHTFATHLLNEGADLNAIKDLLGHSSLAATQVYTHNSIKKLKDIHKLAHPKA